MTQKDESPNASEGPYWSEELLAVLVVGLGDETQARERKLCADRCCRRRMGTFCAVSLQHMRGRRAVTIFSSRKPADAIMTG